MLEPSVATGCVDGSTRMVWYGVLRLMLVSVGLKIYLPSQVGSTTLYIKLNCGVIGAVLKQPVFEPGQARKTDKLCIYFSIFPSPPRPVE